MKKVIFFILILGLGRTFLFGQLNEESRREIVTIGYAEKEYLPDNIIFSVELTEYLEGKDRVSINQIEKDFFDIVNEMGIADSLITLRNSYLRKWTAKRNRQEILYSKEYEIKFKEIQKLEQFSQELEKITVSKRGITGIELLNKKEIDHELKAMAVVDAKQKAILMLGELGATLGNVAKVEEIYEYGTITNEPYSFDWSANIVDGLNSNVLKWNGSAWTSGNYAASVSNIVFKPIKLIASVKVTFIIE